MTDEQREHFRQRLLRQRSELDARIQASQQQAQDTYDLAETTEDRAERSDLADDALAQGTRLTDELRDVDDAILRMERGSYGTCEECGRPIALERLEALPAARLCAEDAEEAERAARGHAPTL